MKRLPSISIIIPTFNRVKVLKPALLSLNGLDYPRGKLEVVVVSDGSTDGTDEMMEQIGKKLNYRLSFIKEERRGISHAKNVAIEHSRGEIIVSTDDDCMFEPDWLKKLIAPFKDSRVASTGGPDRAYKEGNLFSMAANYAFSCFVGSGGVHGRPVPVKIGRFCPMGCNMAIRKKALDEVGLFDEKIAPGEETDLLYRLGKAGYQTVSVPEAFVWHRAIDNLDGFIRMVFRRGKARVIMVQRHGLISDFIYFLPALMVLTLSGLLLSSFLMPLLGRILTALIIIYSFILLSAGLSAFSYYRRGYCLFVVPLLIFIQHFTHGVGFLTATIELFWRRFRG